MPNSSLPVNAPSANPQRGEVWRVKLDLTRGDELNSQEFLSPIKKFREFGFYLIPNRTWEVFRKYHNSYYSRRNQRW